MILGLATVPGKCHLKQQRNGVQRLENTVNSIILWSKYLAKTPGHDDTQRNWTSLLCFCSKILGQRQHFLITEQTVTALFSRAFYVHCVQEPIIRSPISVCTHISIAGAGVESHATLLAQQVTSLSVSFALADR